jgi:peptidyl-tRNA hydrolase, PTH1 family
MRLVVGLGNPGNEYVGTRHNVGWEVLDALAVRLHWIDQGREFNRLARKKFDGLALDGSSPAGNKVLLLKPTTFMNASGQAVQSAMAFYQLSPADVMIVLDDMALPCGKIRIRAGGSSGGHNGLKDIERALATDQYPRLRLGIDSPPPPMAGHDYVLGKFTAAQRPTIDEAARKSAEAIVAWLDQGLETAMNGFNQGTDKAK